MENLPKFDLFPRLTKAGRFIANIVRPVHILASHGDHMFEHPLDTPVGPVTSLNFPYDSEGSYHHIEVEG